MASSLQQAVLSDAKLNEAIESCDKEPIHIPGSIQPHGFMIILNNAYTIIKVSQNFAEFLHKNPRKLIGTPLSEFVSEEKITELKSLTSEGALNPIRSTLLSLKIEDAEYIYDAIIHKTGSVFVLELELRASDIEKIGQQDFYRDVMAFSVHLQKVEDQQTLFDYVAAEIRRVTGFARVKLYKFDENWNGKVVAESKESHMSSYMGLQFPHSDIPKQARNLYARNYLRLIPDVTYKPIPLFPDDRDGEDKPIDLSFSVLRSVSPVHMQYLQNMDVMSSMSISVMQNDKLWGLIACHHDKPLFVPYAVRMAAELLGHTFSAFLSTMRQTDETLESVEKKSYINELSGVFTPNASLMSVLKDKYDLILNSVNADGVIIHLDGKYYAFGLIPEMEFAKTLIKWLEDNHDDKVFVTSSIARDTNLPVMGQSMASGVLAIPVSSNMVDYIMWFREGQSQQVEWAGRPEKKITNTEAGFHLTPRASFTRWKEEVRGISTPWSEIDVEMGKNVSKLLLAKKYEDRLRQKNEDLNSILNNSNAVIYIMDIDGRIINMNNTGLSYFGLEKEDTISNHFRDIFNKEFSDIIEKNTKKVLSSQQSMTFEKDFELNGKAFHLISVKFPLYDASDDIYALCTISTDISNLRQTEEELTRSNKELERMAFIASHDLQEPLRVISNFSQRLERDYREQLDDKAKKYIDFTVQATERMNNLISDLLQYSRLVQEEKQFTLIDTEKVITELLEQYEINGQNKNIFVICEEPFPRIPMQENHFACVMQNLISNGLKYATSDRGPEVKVILKEQEHDWLFGVFDNGIGIKKEYFDKIFEIFQRLHTAQQYSGTGIGLALCKRIVESYGGKIWVESEPGQGSQFYFSIPKMPVNTE